MKKLAVIVDQQLNQIGRNYVSNFIRDEVRVFSTENGNGYEGLPEPSDEVKSNINEDVFEVLLHLGNVSVKDGLNIREHYKSDQSSWIFYNRFKLYFEVRNFLYYQSQLMALSGQFEKLIVLTDRQMDAVFKEQLANVEFRSFSRRKNKINLGQIHYLVTAFARFIIGFLESFRGNSKGIFVIDSVFQYRKMLNKELTISHQNAYFNGLFEELGDHQVLDHFMLQKDPGFRFKWQFLSKRGNRNRIFSEWIIGSFVFNPFNWKTLFNIRRNHLKKAAFLIQDSVDPAMKYMLAVLTQSVNSLVYFNLKYEAYKHFFSKSSCRIVLTIDENSANNRAILDAAKQMGIYTLAYQHGSMHRLNPSYRFHPDDYPYNPIPDLTLVWDDYWANYLVKEAGYPTNRVKVTGQVQTDIIPALMSSNLVTDYRSDFNSSQLVLFASQPIRDHGLQKHIVTSLINALKELDDVHLVYRPHPRETDNQWVIELSEELDFKRIGVQGNVDLYLQLASVDCVVTYFSTVGMEAKYFGKQLIVFDVLGEDVLGFVKNKMGIGVQSEEGLKKQLTDHFQKTNQAEVLPMVDGKALERLKAEIEMHI